MEDFIDYLKVMQVQLDIGFDQLVHLVKNLTPTQWNQLKSEVEKNTSADKEKQDMELFLLGAPTFNPDQLKAVEEARKSINQWRQK